MSAPFAHQAGCVVIEGRGVLIEGAPGAGKSSLALALIDRGAGFVGDDSVMLEVVDGRLLARPHPNTRGLMEIRGLGLVPMPVVDAAPVAFVLSLSRDAPRYIEQAPIRRLGAVDLPHITLWPDSPVLHLRAEWALRHYGLPSAPLEK
ncbi:serine kinase [Novosphingobium umbonatum]|uniref:Serine kinase n=1 Tax=Novosphingobium umbonatum TaxID=1908524 RepID=A0A3S2Y975_9SPHN|nr:HPr kinase/phosphatase C-terminal domain-containing protein [Novosphingobium umbonatum]RVU06398.1 serine kinase [Novosphingobium umbonatum]